MPIGRPKFKITKAVCNKAEGLASEGLTKAQIASCLGIHYDTLNEKTKIHPDFSDAIKRGQAKGIAAVSNSLFESAIGGNVTAQIFYLKNRNPDCWNEKRTINLSHETPHIISDKIIDHNERVKLADEFMQCLVNDGEHF